MYDYSRLIEAGVSWNDAQALRRIAMTLHRWFELECGDGNNYSSWVITRGHKRNRVTFDHDDDGKPYLEVHPHNENKTQYMPIPDRERGAKKRLSKIMERYPELTVYIQTDPRGAPLYVLRREDVDGKELDQVYNSRGIAIYK